jgi:RNA polymerase sigma-70 factor (ECF subfamily)
MTDAADRIYERLLVLRCQAGDEAAFAELVGRYHDRLRYVLRRLLGDAHAADDAAQEVWLDVWRGLPRLTHATAFPAWLYRIARDRAYRRLRGRRPSVLPLDAEKLPAGDRLARAAEDVEQLHAALGRLTPEHRDVLRLRFLNELSYEDVARALGCPIGTVRSRLHAARLALRRALAGETHP